jgi:DNA-binding SARP family transcriptional activator
MATASAAVEPAVDAHTLLRRGLAESHRGEFRSLQTLAAALAAMQRDNDQPGSVLAAAALVVAQHSINGYRRFAEHAQALAPFRDRTVTFDDPADELLAQCGSLCAMLMLSPAEPGIDACAQRMLALIELDIDVNLRFAAGRLLLYYTEPRENRELGQRIYALLQPLADDPALTRYRFARWLILWMRATADAKDRLQHRLACDTARRLAGEGQRDLVIWLAVGDIEQGVRTRDFARVDRALESLEQVADATNLAELAVLEWMRGRVALAKGAGDAALFHATRCRRYAEELEVPAPMMGVRLALEAQARLLVGDYDGARETFGRAASIVAVLHAEEMRDMVRMVDAYEALVRRRPEARDRLAEAFAAPRARRFHDTFDTNPTFGATMCAHALEHGVEVEFVRHVIQLHAFAPPPEAGPAWPWPVRVLALGAFELSRAGSAVAFHGKIQKKPLELLKALVAAGPHPIDKARLCDLLWPDAEPDAAAAALDMAVSRLRRMLGLPATIRIEDGRIGLDAAQAWVDAWAFDRDVEALQSALRAPGGRPDDEIDAIAQRLLARYRGPFLDNEEPRQWTLAARERWRSRFLRSLADAGRHWEGRERWDKAIELYQRGVEVDSLAEDLYRKLMHCHLALGQPAEAARAFRRCRDMLSVQLGIPPSAETDALFQSIYRR